MPRKGPVTDRVLPGSKVDKLFINDSSSPKQKGVNLKIRTIIVDLRKRQNSRRENLRFNLKHKGSKIFSEGKGRDRVRSQDICHLKVVYKFSLLNVIRCVTPSASKGLDRNSDLLKEPPITGS